MRLSFDHVTLGQRVLFGTGKAAEHVATAASDLGARRAMVIASASQMSTAKRVSSGLDVVTWHDEVVMHVPLEVAERARSAAAGADLVVSVGGGSTTGLAKAVALSTGLPIIAVPTTYSGSEATNVWGLTDRARKTTGVDNRVLPAVVVYDAELTLSLPKDLSVASGLNSIAHCVDSLWAPRADPMNAALAAEGIRVLSLALPAIAADPVGVDGRERALYGGYLAAVAFASAGSGMHHKICHVLGGTFDLPHAETHAIVLPHVLAFNAPCAPEAVEHLAAAVGVSDVLAALWTLGRTLEAPRALADYGFTSADIDEAVRIALPAIPASNPRPPTASNLTDLLRAALTGEEPGRIAQRADGDS
ncbi:maleylacetate reductase [Brevibacterium sanguinis]|uniref:Maleylacetate reductase n=2 Tax=Brevibacterium TaxID=1696 RepID=A0A366IMT4_9MICO|nr:MULTISPECIES: maleylacetate reductase [Brevibacterium]RBP65732.1 maleylacetate reductase [Brevibacterium sanguinis]RBP72366.1 maleylacetate reductase [Brevibacterium celere]